MQNNQHIQRLRELAQIANRENIGDVFEEAIDIRANNFQGREETEANFYMQHFLMLAREAEIGWGIYAQPPKPNPQLDDKQSWQLIAMVSALHELMFCFESINEASILTFENSTAVRFYINSIFSYVSALFLLDWKNNEKLGLRYPGTAIKPLDSLGLVELLEPIFEVLDTPFGTITIGETIRKVRNNQFVHGTFSYEDIEEIAEATNIHELAQKIRQGELLFRLFEQIIILKLKLVSILSDAEVDAEQLALDFQAQL